jgi:hypothetical protein
VTTKHSVAGLSNWPLPELNMFQGSIWATLLERQKLLTWFALIMLVCAIVALVVAVFDDRLVRGANLWFKPIKFMVSTAAFALTTAWLMGLLEPVQRHSTLMQGMAWVLIITAAFEVIYITGAAALGGESHHNTGTPLKAAMFSLMAVAAVALTATQAVVAWAIWRSAPVAPLPVAAHAVIIGLVLTWLLGTASGFLLGGKQPPAFSQGALPLIGWHLGGGDGRPAHFLGLHAHQLLPFLGFVLQRFLPHAVGTGVLWVSSAAYVGAWWWLMRLALR